MEAFVADLDRSGETHRPEKFSDFRKVLANVAAHPNRRYFIFKSIILNNLYGVDIMEEAVEICKLRLFLKLAAQVEPDTARENLGIEPLPDIDFNIKAGNTLVGYTGLEQIRDAAEQAQPRHGARQGRLLFPETAARIDQIEALAADLQQAFDAFRARQVEGDGSVPVEDKQELRKRLAALDEELNRYLAGEYGVEPSKTDAYAKWLKSHQPFHWFVEFYGIVNWGGFNVVVGNPPYVEWSKVPAYRPQTASYTTLACGNIYTAICERSYGLLSKLGRFGMIVPISCVATERMRPLRDVWTSHQMLTHGSFYSGDAHPSVLFNGVKFRLAILIQAIGAQQQGQYSTHFQRWYPEHREALFHLIQYTPFDSKLVRGSLWPKVCSETHRGTLSRLCAQKVTLAHFVNEGSRHEVYSHRIVAHFVKALDFVPHFSSERDGNKRSEDYKVFGVATAIERDVLAAVLNSTLFYQWFVTYSDVYHCGREIILDFPTDLASMTTSCGKALRSCNAKLMKSLRHDSVRRRIPYQKTGIVEYDEFYPRLSKALIDEIDNVLARHLAFSEEELDFIINYDIKFRMGRDAEREDE